MVGREAQRIQQYELFTTNQSPLTAPTEFYPVYIYEGNKITMHPDNLTGNNTTDKVIQLNYLYFPADPKWGFDVDTELGHYVYNELDSQDFEIHKHPGGDPTCNMIAFKNPQEAMLFKLSHKFIG